MYEFWGEHNSLCKMGLLRNLRLVSCVFSHGPLDVEGRMGCGGGRRGDRRLERPSAAPEEGRSAGGNSSGRGRVRASCPLSPSLRDFSLTCPHTAFTHTSCWGTPGNSQPALCRDVFMPVKRDSLSINKACPCWALQQASCVEGLCGRDL